MDSSHSPEPAPRPAAPLNSDRFSQILYEDTEIIAVSKPPGMVVHPAPGSWNGTFVNALVYHLEKNAEDSEGGVFQSQADARDGEHYPGLRPGIVHRLDKGTTGVLLAAKNPTMQAKLAELFAKRQVSLLLRVNASFVCRVTQRHLGAVMIRPNLLTVMISIAALVGSARTSPLTDSTQLRLCGVYKPGGLHFAR